MALTEAGAEWTLRRMAGEESAPLSSGTMIVRDGTQVAEAPIEAVRIESVDGTSRVVVAARFGERDANFEWRERGVVVGGALVDLTVQDEGRKAVGTVWVAESIIEVARA